jgi:hypothetical protein
MDLLSSLNPVAFAFHLTRTPIQDGTLTQQDAFDRSYRMSAKIWKACAKDWDRVEAVVITGGSLRCREK